VSRHHLQWTLLGRAQVPQLDCAITACRQQLVLIGLVKAHIEGGVWCFHLLHDSDTRHWVDVEDGDGTSADEAKVLCLCYGKLRPIEGAPTARDIAHIGAEKLRGDLRARN